ncbi:MAG: GNAT family N-acetyltransferase, partial [Planctomycetaceae bacterium]
TEPGRAAPVRADTARLCRQRHHPTMTAQPQAIIRPATPADAVPLAEVHIAAWQAAYRGLMPDDMLDRLDVQQRARAWQQVLAEGASTTLICERGGQFAGFATFGPTRDEDDDPRQVGEIQAIYVRPSCWRQGIGEALCRAAMEDIIGQGVREVTLWVLERNHPARRFYEAQGFRPDGGIKSECYGEPLSVVRYRNV